MSLIFFFFQAEDGIRDHCVTGVQTCALPICITGHRVEGAPGIYVRLDDPRSHAMLAQRPQLRVPGSPAPQPDFSGLGKIAARSEERRVGKEGRSRWSPYH